MKNKLNQIILATLSTLSIVGCLADGPVTDTIKRRSKAPPEAANASPSDLPNTDQAQVAAAGNFHEIVNLAFNQCIDAPNGALNVILKVAACNGSDTQKWSFVAAPSPNTFFLVNKRSGFCAEVNNGTSTPGERVDEFHCNGSQASNGFGAFASSKVYLISSTGTSEPPRAWTLSAELAVSSCNSTVAPAMMLRPGSSDSDYLNGGSVPLRAA